MSDPKKRPKIRDAGLEGSVMCHCLVEGKTKSPPFPMRMIHSVSGWRLDEPWTGHETQHEQFREWMKSPCEHPRMRLVCEVFQWRDIAKFRYALLSAGWDYFMAILRAFPEKSNAGGSTTVAEALNILEELKYFHHKAELGWATVLVNTDNGREIAEYTTAYQGTFLWTAGKRELRLDDDGFFVKDTASRKILFRSVKFMQILRDWNERNVPEFVEFVDLITARRLRSDAAVSQRIPWPDGEMYDERGYTNRVWPIRMHATTRKLKVSDFYDVAMPLENLCKIALLEHQPIWWSHEDPHHPSA